jgi:hypothetical protein
MRIIHEAAGRITKSEETSSTTAESVWSMYESAAPRSRPSAVSRLMTCAIEGLAAYAEATHPYLVDPRDDTGCRTEASDPRAPRKTQDYRSEDWAHSGRPSPRLALRAPRVSLGSRAATLFAKLRFRRRNKAPVVSVDTLDDRVLRDIGVDRHQFQFWTGQMGPDGW